MGASSKEAAQETGFSEATVSLIKRSEVGQKKLEEMNKELDEDAISTAKAIHELIPQAISVYEDILSGEDQTAKACDKLRAADAVCDRGGLPRVSSTNINGQIGHVHATAAEITAIKERAIKIAREAGLLVDVRAAE